MDEESTSTVRRRPRNAVGRDARRERLRRYVTWTAEDVAEFDGTLRVQRVVDTRDWQ